MKKIKIELFIFQMNIQLIYKVKFNFKTKITSLRTEIFFSALSEVKLFGQILKKVQLYEFGMNGNNDT
jgi:hypothetical protein